MVKYCFVLLLASVTFVTAIYDVKQTDYITGPLYPFLVSIKELRGKTSEHECGGAIISQDYVLTSADCLMGPIDRIGRLTAGSPRLNYGGFLHLMTEKHIHPGYETGNNDNNIALAKVSPSFRLGKDIQSASLVTPQDDILSSVHFAGWGAINRTVFYFASGLAQFNYAYSDNLRDVELQVIENKECNEYGMDVDDKEMCTLTHVGQGLCYKDHGGPLIITKGSDKAIVAIATERNFCGDGFPDVYTRVLPFVEWINATCKCIL